MWKFSNLGRSCVVVPTPLEGGKRAKVPKNNIYLFIYLFSIASTIVPWWLWHKFHYFKNAKKINYFFLRVFFF